MPDKTIYIRAGDEELWRKAEAQASGSLSGLLAGFIRKFVADKEEAQADMDRVTVEVYDKATDGLVQKVFKGRWLISPNAELQSTANAGIYWAVAQTARGNIAFLRFGEGRDEENDLLVFADLDEAEAQGIPVDIIESARAAIDPDYVQELDI